MRGEGGRGLSGLSSTRLLRPTEMYVGSHRTGEFFVNTASIARLGGTAIAYQSEAELE